MIYGLVIVTSLGATTLLSTFDNRLNCLTQAGMIREGSNSQAQCWPGSSEESIRANVREINETTSKTTVIRK